MVDPEDEGIRLTCLGKRWFPQPEVQWKDVMGDKIPLSLGTGPKTMMGCFKLRHPSCEGELKHRGVLHHEESLLWTRAGENNFYHRSALLVLGTGQE